MAWLIFFFQAEDGIRDSSVTGVQTCALPIFVPSWRGSARHGHDPVVPVPPSLADLLGERVARLPQDAREVLLLVSAAGRLSLARLRGIGEEARLWPALGSAPVSGGAMGLARSVGAVTPP